MMGGQGSAAMMGDQKGDMTQMSSMMHEMADRMMSMPGDMGKSGNAEQQQKMGDMRSR